MAANIHPATINPEKILRELRELWVDLGKQQEVPGGVLRACSMTLVAVADSSFNERAAGNERPASGQRDEMDAVHRMVGVLMHDHPSRAIVLAPQAGAELNARVFSECWMPYHSRQQICAEGIEIVADDEQLDEVARVMMAFVVPDLPVVLWCRGPRAFLDRTLDPLFPLARKIIFDTGAARHAPSAIEFLRRLRREGRTVADLAWTRLTGWRETIASLFDGGFGDPHRFTSIQVLHDGARPGSEAIYLARWIDRACPGAGVTIEPGPEGDSAPPPLEANGLSGVIFSAPGEKVKVQRHESVLEIHAMGGLRRRLSVHTSPLPQMLEESLMREELSILDRDPVFERVLR
jgi:hypothetical protein